MKPAALSPAFAALALAGCAVAPPAAPSVLVMPGQGKSFAQFQAEDAQCRQAAAQGVSGEVAQAGNSAAGSAVLGTIFYAAIGAAYGFALGDPAGGAAIGAGTGLFLGGAGGANAAAFHSVAIQRHYDVTYLQCMESLGNTVPVTASGGGYAYPLYGYPYPPPYGYPYD